MGGELLSNLVYVLNERASDNPISAGMRRLPNIYSMDTLFDKIGRKARLDRIEFDIAMKLLEQSGIIKVDGGKINLIDKWCGHGESGSLLILKPLQENGKRLLSPGGDGASGIPGPPGIRFRGKTHDPHRRPARVYHEAVDIPFVVLLKFLYFRIIFAI